MRYLWILLLVAGTINAKDINNDDPNRLSVNGEWVLHRPADKATIKLGVLTSDKDVEKALHSNAEKMKNILAVIKEKGISEKEIKAGSFTVTPQHTLAPKDPPPEWRSTITGYEVRHTFSVQTIHLEIVGTIVDVAAKEGANLFEGIIFSLQDQQTVQSEAITKAVQQARVYADSAAQAAGVRIGDVLDLTINPSGVTPRVWQAQRYSASYDTDTQVATGEVDVTASVSIIYEIKHK